MRKILISFCIVSLLLLACDKTNNSQMSGRDISIDYTDGQYTRNTDSHYTRITEGSYEEFYFVENANSVELSRYRFFPFDTEANPDEITVVYLEIPDTFNGKPVKIIGDFAFYGTRMTTLKLPTYLEMIGKEAFWGSYVEEILFNETLALIDEGAFTLSNVKDLVIPDSVTTLGNKAFTSSWTEHLRLGSNLKTIGEYAFSGNDIATVVFPETLEVIEPYAFFSNSISKVTIPANVYRIGHNAFDSISEVTIGANVELVEIDTYGQYTYWNDFAVFYNRNGRRAGTYRTSERLVPGGVESYWLHEENWDEPEHVEAREQVQSYRDAMNSYSADEEM